MATKYKSGKIQPEHHVRYCINCHQKNPAIVTQTNGQKCGYCGGDPGYEYRKEKIK